MDLAGQKESVGNSGSKEEGVMSDTTAGTIVKKAMG